MFSARSLSSGHRRGLTRSHITGGAPDQAAAVTGRDLGQDPVDPDRADQDRDGRAPMAGGLTAIVRHRMGETIQAAAGQAGASKAVDNKAGASKVAASKVAANKMAASRAAVSRGAASKVAANPGMATGRLAHPDPERQPVTKCKHRRVAMLAVLPFLTFPQRHMSA